MAQLQRTVNNYMEEAKAAAGFNTASGNAQLQQVIPMTLVDPLRPTKFQYRKRYGPVATRSRQLTASMFDGTVSIPQAVMPCCNMFGRLVY